MLGHRQGAYILGHALPTQAGSLYPRTSPPHTVYRQGAYILGHHLPTQGGSLYPIGHHLPTQGGSLYPIGHHFPTHGGSLYPRTSPPNNTGRELIPLHTQGAYFCVQLTQRGAHVPRKSTPLPTLTLGELVPSLDP